ncbi:hypothetical protein T265_02047 [Opisthorchis viverrini]|uniref:Uncharacterized protein n=1 Tax=Opisthorchis viverrini TaxID=6198 RepID=A0A075A804_OPIVI|nr:hypothetical protein T265_02047 [Opisthorchis viverrini]KER31820.1 hypothetical protein T265_02047 [Opisthorchis viverrini]
MLSFYDESNIQSTKNNIALFDARVEQQQQQVTNMHTQMKDRIRSQMTLAMLIISQNASDILSRRTTCNISQSLYFVQATTREEYAHIDCSNKPTVSAFDVSHYIPEIV